MVLGLLGPSTEKHSTRNKEAQVQAKELLTSFDNIWNNPSFGPFMAPVMSIDAPDSRLHMVINTDFTRSQSFGVNVLFVLLWRHTFDVWVTVWAYPWLAESSWIQMNWGPWLRNTMHAAWSLRQGVFAWATWPMRLAAGRKKGRLTKPPLGNQQMRWDSLLRQRVYHERQRQATWVLRLLCKLLFLSFGSPARCIYVRDFGRVSLGFTPRKVPDPPLWFAPGPHLG